MRLGQHMRLAPRMIQSMEILQMPILQLEERIAQELESNATLELAEPGDQDGVSPAAAGQDGLTAAADGPPVPREFFEPAARAARAGLDRDPKAEAMANTAARAASLADQLRQQWSLAEVEESLVAPGELIISYIDDDGYLRTPLEAILDRAPAEPAMTMEGLERALRAVQLLLEPPGVAARDLRECLLLQIDAIISGDPRADLHPGSDADAAAWGVARKLVEEHLEDLAQNRLPRIAERLGLPVEGVKGAIEHLHALSIAPARRLVQESAPIIIPDAIVEHDADHDRYIAYLNDSRIPNLRVNQEYARLARERETPKPTREFLRKNLSNAAWLIDAVEQRKRTLQRVLNVVVDAQRDYFDYGPQALRPLPMTQVAEQLGVHVATVSRAVADKHVFTPRGVVPLRGFFSSGTQTRSGEEVSWDAVKAALKEVIDGEDKKEPLSDDQLAEEVGRRGVGIARRTVAKYRAQLNIPSARLRRQF